MESDKRKKTKDKELKAKANFNIITDKKLGYDHIIPTLILALEICQNTPNPPHTHIYIYIVCICAFLFFDSSHWRRTIKERKKNREFNPALYKEQNNSTN